MSEIPAAKRYKFVKLEKRLLIVDPPNLTVVARSCSRRKPRSSLATVAAAHQDGGRGFDALKSTAQNAEKPIA
jgi:hypothetical protein